MLSDAVSAASGDQIQLKKTKKQELYFNDFKAN